MMSPAAAQADDSLIEGDPRPGAVLEHAPGAVTVRFGATVYGPDSHLAVSTAVGDDVTTGETTQPAPRELRVPIAATAPDDLTVAYHVVFTDGATATGAYRFSAGTGVPPAPLSRAAEQAVTAAVAQHVHGVDPVGAALLVIDGAVLLIVFFLLWARPRNGRRAAAWRYREE